MGVTYENWHLFCRGRVTVHMFVLNDSWTWDKNWEYRKWEGKAGAYSCSEAPTVLARCPGTVGSLLGAAFLAVKAEHALCHSWGAVLPNCLFSTTLSSISLLTAPLPLENANKAWLSCQIWKSHSTRHRTVWKFVKRVLCQERQRLQDKHKAGTSTLKRQSSLLVPSTWDNPQISTSCAETTGSTSGQDSLWSPETPLTLHSRQPWKKNY